MRGSIRIIMAAAVAVCMFAFTAASAFALPDQLLTSATGVELRDTATAPANQPSAIELVNDGNIELEAPVGTSICTEGEFGAFVVGNKGATDPGGDPNLTVPFGVFENCTVGAANAPVYVDTTGTPATSGIAATVNDDGAPNALNVVLKGFKISLIKSATESCQFENVAAGLIGALTNGGGPFTEEAATNQTAVDFKNQELEGGVCGKAKVKAGKFFVETMSDSPGFTGSSDTVFFRG